MTFIFEV